MDGLVITETLYDSSVTRVQRGIYKNEIPVIIKVTAQEIPSVELINQYAFSSLAQNKVDHDSVNRVVKEISDGAGRVLILEDIGGVAVKFWIQSILQELPRWPLEDPALFHSWILRLLRWSISLAEGVVACHQQNIIHNDINPANVIVNPSTDQVQLIDFGAAFPEGSNINEWTVVEQYRTLTYISPEQTGRLNRNVDYRSDYYALGATLYQLFSSRAPFIANDLPELIHCHIARHPMSLNQMNPLIPGALSALVTKLMAKAPEDRYQNGRCLIRDLKAIEKSMVSGIPFPLASLGESDVPEQLLIPTKLYGRDVELAVLRQALSSLHDKPALIAVEGEAGGGKTTLITEAIFHGLNTPNMLLAGKSDAYNKQPHNAISQALATSVDVLLSLPDSKFLPWRAELLRALNQNPHTLIGLCPTLAVIFETAEFAEKTQLHNAGIQLNLHTAIFLQHLSRLEPVLLFIDDVQWCDCPSMALLEALVRANHPRITVMVTCRSEEVDERHAYCVMKGKIFDEGICSVILPLNNLDVGQITQLLMATFHADQKRLPYFSELLLEKTSGNPLFVHEFLKAAHHRKDGTLFYDERIGAWNWNARKLEQIALSGNVAALLIDALHKQDEYTQELLQWASCIGTRFNERLLAQVAGVSIEEIKNYLNAVYQRGYIHRIVDHQGSYAFNHDRIRQACYELQLDDVVAQRHWIIGMASLELSLNNAELVGDPLPHFLAALDNDIAENVLKEQETIEWLIDSFYAGAQSAKEKTANDIALRYIGCALTIYFKANHNKVSLLSHLLMLQGELGYLTADIALGGKAFDEYREINASVILRAESYSKQAPLAFMRGDVEGSIDCSLRCFRLLGVATPDFSQDIDLPLQFQRDVFDSLKGFEKISNLDAITASDVSEQSILQSTASNMLLLLGTRAKYQWAEWFGLVGINDLLISGVSTSSLQLLALFDSLIFSSNQYKYDQTIVEWTRKVSEKNGRFGGMGFVFGNMGAYSGRYNKPLERCLSDLSRGAKVSFESGEYLPYIACVSNRIVLEFSAGVPLKALNETVLEHQRFLVSCGEFVSAGKYYSRLLDQLIKFDSEDLLSEHCFTKLQWGVLSNSAAFGAYHHLRLQNHFWRREYKSVVDYFKTQKGNLDKLHGMAPVDDNHFLYAIACLQCGENESVDFFRSVELVNTLADICPSNYLHKSLLIEAEKMRCRNDLAATDCYQKAALDAKDNGFIHMYALAHELHAFYWQENGREDFSRYHVYKAKQGYQRWECGLKLEQIDVCFDQSLRLLPLSSDLDPSSGYQIVELEPGGIYGQDKMSGHESLSGYLGQKKLLKIANVVAEELDLKQRLVQIIQLAVENTSSSFGILLLEKNGIFVPSASAYTNSNAGLSKVDTIDIPKDIVARCEELKKPILISNISKFSFRGGDSDNDKFFRSYGVKSLLCYPVVYKGRCQHLFLLANLDEKSVFSWQDVQFLNTLGPQFAVSIENAKLYQDRQAFNVILEQRVAQRTSELQAANEELHAFTASVSHDLKAPLRAIRGFAGALYEDCEEGLGNEGKRYVSDLVDSAEYMEKIIDGLLTLSCSTQTTLQWEEVNLSTLVEDKLRWLRTMEPEHRVVDTIQRGLMSSCDLRLMRQAIDNLIENAWKYSRGGEIYGRKPTIAFGIMESNCSEHIFYVRDNGVGFDAENAEELFSPFRRYHPVSEFDGAGIGLATVYRIIKRHGGNVWVDSTPNNGATFYFTLSNGELL